MPPSLISLGYAGTGYPDNLKLWRWNSIGWANATCAGYEDVPFPGNAFLVVPVCQTGIYAFSVYSPADLVDTPTPTTVLKFVSQAANDGWTLESSETSKKGGTLDAKAITLRLGDDAVKKQYRSILSFSTGASLPDNAVITKVTLNIKKQKVIGGGNPLTTFQGFMVDVKKGIFGTAALQAGDFQTRASKSYGPFKPGLASGWYSIDLTAGSAYINKLSTASGLTQIRLRFKLDDNNNAKANYLSLHSGNAKTAANRPQLIVEYYVP